MVYRVSAVGRRTSAGMSGGRITVFRSEAQWACRIGVTRVPYA